MYRIKNGLFLLSIFIIFTGCATQPNAHPPKGPLLSEIVFPEPAPGNATLFLLRNRGIGLPNYYAANIYVDGERQFSVPVNGFAFLELPIGKHVVELQWDSWQMSNVKRTINLTQNQEYYYYIGGIDASFQQIRELDDRFAKGLVEHYCRLTDDLAANVTLKTPLQIRNGLTINQLLEEEKEVFFSDIKIGQKMEQVVSLLGDPDKVYLEKTGKIFIPFYWGPDFARATFSYTRIGSVTFRRTSTGANPNWIVHEFEYDDEAI